MTKVEALLEMIYVSQEAPSMVEAIEVLLVEDGPVRVEAKKDDSDPDGGTLHGGHGDPEPVKEKPKKAAPAKPAQRKSRVDVGRIKALRTGGWTIADIADDVKCSQQTVRNNLAKLGMK